jgi:hypothetical protein
MPQILLSLSSEYQDNVSLNLIPLQVPLYIRVEVVVSNSSAHSPTHFWRTKTSMNYESPFPIAPPPNFCDVQSPYSILK